MCYYISMLSRSSYFFRTAAFLTSSFFRTVTFFAVIISEQLLFQSETSTEQPLLDNRKLFRAVTFRSNYLFGGGIVQKKRYLQKNYFFKAGTSAHHQLFQESYILEKATNSEKQCSLLPTFPGELPFQSGRFFKRRYLLQHYLFRRPAFLQDTFSEELLLHSYASFPQLHYLFICQ